MMGVAQRAGPMIHHLRIHHRQKSLAVSAVIVAALLCLFLLSHATAPWVLSRLYTDVYAEYNSPTPAVESFGDLVAALWRPYVHGINNATYTTDDGRKYAIPTKNHHWTEGLGKDVLILDVDTRPLKKPSAFGKHSIFDDDQMTPRSAGMLNHYIYAQIHGYDYKFLRASGYRDRHNTWVKVPMIRKALEDHKIVVFLDSDATFAQPQVPIEWLLNLWDVRPNRTLLVMPEDPNSAVNRDAKGWVLWNTGFVIAQNLERTHELLNAWEDCPVGNKWPACHRWARDWAHEQAAFGNHVRYAYNHTEGELRAIPCMDGNGAPYIFDKRCGGVFVSHHWGKKEMTVKNLHSLVSGALLRHLKDGRNDLVFDAFVHPTQGKLNEALNDLLLDIGGS